MDTKKLDNVNKRINDAKKNLDKDHLLKFYKDKDGPGLRTCFESLDAAQTAAAWAVLTQCNDGETKDELLARVSWVHQWVVDLVLDKAASFECWDEQ